MARYEPDFYIELVRSGGTEPLRQRVIDLDFSDAATETDLVTVTVEDINTTLLDDPALIDDGNTELRFRFGYVGELSETHTAMVTMVKPNFPQTGAITIQIKAHDKGILANKDIKTRVWERPEGYRPDEIATEIAGELGMTPQVEACKEETRKLRWNQSKETDLEFLKRIAKEAVPEKDQQNSNYIVHISGDTLYFATRANEGEPTHEFTYFASEGGDLLSFSPEIQEKKVEPATETRSSETGETVRSQPSTTPRTSLGKSDVNPAKPRNTGMGPQEPGSEGGGGAGGGRVVVDPVTGIVTRPAGAAAADVGQTKSAKGEQQTNPFTPSKTNKESDVAKNAAETRENKEKTYTARATVIGTPTLRANTLIKINNVGAKFGGNWWIKTVNHKIGPGGYLCDLDLQKDAIATEDADTSGFGDTIRENAGTGTTPTAPRPTGPQEPGSEGGGGGGGGGRVVVDPRTGEVIRPRPTVPRPGGPQEPGSEDGGTRPVIPRPTGPQEPGSEGGGTTSPVIPRPTGPQEPGAEFGTRSIMDARTGEIIG